MSNIDKSITNDLVIPSLVGSEIFKGREDASFAIGIIAAGDEIRPGIEDEYTTYLRLRANVYGYQTNMLAIDEIEAQGGIDIDADDVRSAHIGIFENADPDIGLVRSNSSLRIITKSEQHSAKLPVEDFFPGAFPEGPLALGAIEISRYIARHERPGIQRALTPPLFAAAVSYIMRNGLGPTYATVERSVEADLTAKGVPNTRIADPVYVKEYQADNLGLFIDVPQMAQNIEAQAPGTLAAMQQTEHGFVYFGRRQPQTGAAA
jgi:hypothetical protein